MDTLVGLLKNVQYIVENKTFICPVTYEKKHFKKLSKIVFFNGIGNKWQSTLFASEIYKNLPMVPTLLSVMVKSRNVNGTLTL